MAGRRHIIHPKNITLNRDIADTFAVEELEVITFN